ncbi:MAG: hypothetical protein WC823_06680 [Parcubacteria group bacterium]|jgi:hypothetical protein
MEIKTHAIDRIFAYILEGFIKNMHPVAAFFVFVLAYSMFVLFLYGFDKKEALIKELKGTSWREKCVMLIKFLLGLLITYFLFYRLMIMTAMLDYPLPESVQFMGRGIISFLESVGLLSR